MTGQPMKITNMADTEHVSNCQSGNLINLRDLTWIIGIYKLGIAKFTTYAFACGFLHDNSKTH